MLKKSYAVIATLLVVIGHDTSALAKDTAHTRKPAVEASQPSTWKKGATYKGKGNTVANYRDHDLSVPPKGYRWVKDGKTFLLIDTGKGTVRSIRKDADH